MVRIFLCLSVNMCKKLQYCTNGPLYGLPLSQLPFHYIYQCFKCPSGTQLVITAYYSYSLIRYCDVSWLKLLQLDVNTTENCWHNDFVSGSGLREAHLGLLSTGDCLLGGGVVPVHHCVCGTTGVWWHSPGTTGEAKSKMFLLLMFGGGLTWYDFFQWCRFFSGLVLSHVIQWPLL